MSASQEIITIEATIKELLEQFPKYRDSDKKLQCRVWQMQLEPTGRSLKLLTTYDFFDIYSNEQILTPSDSITRAARKIKQKFPHLEGEKQKRIEECPKVQKAVRIKR